MRLLYISSAPEDLDFINKFSKIFRHITCVHSSLFSFCNKYKLDFQTADHNLCFCRHELPKERLNFDLNSLAKFNLEAKLLYSDEVLRNASGFYKTIERKISDNKYDLAIIPSGRMLSQKIMRELCLKYQVPMLFLGYGNYPGKTFLDDLGTDFSSSLSGSNINEYSDENVAHWAENYLSQKLSNPIPPQAKNIFKKKIQRVLRFLLCKFERFFYLSHDTNYKLGQVLRFILATTPKLTFEDIDLSNTDYIFYPCQLSSDAQLILNAELGNLEAVRVASRLSLSKGKQLVVKFHPAETDKSELKEIIKLKEEFNFIISNQNTYEILKYSSEVVTINSTIGIEALAIGKEVTVLGNAIYKNWNSKQAIQYFETVLFNIDYFSREKIDNKVWSQIVKRFQ